MLLFRIRGGREGGGGYLSLSDFWWMGGAAGAGVGFAGVGRPGSIPIRIPNPGIYGTHDIFRGAIICHVFGRLKSGPDGVRESRREEGRFFFGCAESCWLCNFPGKYFPEPDLVKKIKSKSDRSGSSTQ